MSATCFQRRLAGRMGCDRTTDELPLDQGSSLLLKHGLWHLYEISAFIVSQKYRKMHLRLAMSQYSYFAECLHPGEEDVPFAAK